MVRLLLSDRLYRWHFLNALEMTSWEIEMKETLQIIDAQADAVARDAFKMVAPKISRKRRRRRKYSCA